MNRYPLWKNLLIGLVVLMGFIYALPNLYGDDPAVQVSGSRTVEVDGRTRDRVASLLSQAGLAVESIEAEKGTLLARFADTESQFKAYELLRDALGRGHTVALNLAPATPAWLRGLNALPMYLGLDLRGGVHFLLEVDTAAALEQAIERSAGEVRSLLRDERLRYLTVTAGRGEVEVRFKDAADRERAVEFLGRELRDRRVTADEDGAALMVGLTLAQVEEAKRLAIKQNVTTLRNRVNELGVAEPVIQQQGLERIVVQLPGVQDTARAKEILGATATLEYRMVAEGQDAEHLSVGARLYHDRQGRSVLLENRVIITGDQIIDAASGIDPQSGGPMVSVTLDGRGARQMSDNTQENVGRPMAVVYIENKPVTRGDGGQARRASERVEEVISVATIREPFGKRFQTTGLDSNEEARNLALLLRAGALAAPMEIIEERTIGPSLGQDNIDRGVTASLVGFALVVLFMGVYYRGFGLVANVALLCNVVLLVAGLSLLQATLTLPGIAGIVLTMGMAVDANVLIFERIREELRRGNSPQASIKAGFDRAFGTVADANITTLLAALMLFMFGSGPVKGFAITLSIGIVTSMFTAILVSRALINGIWGGRRLKSLPV